MTTGEVADVLRNVFDPELGIDIVALGLVYGIEVANGALTLTMTTTSASCPMSAALVSGVEDALRWHFPRENVTVTVASAPQWDVAMLDDTARAWLGVR